MFEITITEIRKSSELPVAGLAERVERLRLVADVVDVMAVARVAIGVKRKRKKAA